MDRRNGSSLIRLEGPIEITQAAELKALLEEELRTGTELRIALKDAAYLDVTAVQLLWAARREAERAGVGFTIESEAAQAVNAALKDAGFEKISASV